MTSDVLQDQIAYYRARAGEFDEWFYRRGRYDYGEAANAAWFAEAAEVMRALAAVGPVGTVLELACGMGIWTRELLKIGQQITALDAAPEMLAIHARQVPDARVQRQQADLFAWEPEGQYDLVFFSFWLSHVPPERFEEFLAKAVRAVRPGGQLFLVDSRFTEQSGARGQTRPEPQGTRHQRTLNDGSTYTIVKVFYEPSKVQTTLTDLGCDATAHETAQFFYHLHAIKPKETRAS